MQKKLSKSWAVEDFPMVEMNRGYLQERIGVENRSATFDCGYRITGDSMEENFLKDHQEKIGRISHSRRKSGIQENNSPSRHYSHQQNEYTPLLEGPSSAKSSALSSQKTVCLGITSHCNLSKNLEIPKYLADLKRPELSYEQSVYVEEEDEKTEANDLCSPLKSDGVKERKSLWVRFSQKKRFGKHSSKTDRISELDKQYSTTGKLSVASKTTSSSRLHTSIDLGRQGARSRMTSVPGNIPMDDPQWVHLNSCDLYTNRAILIGILSGFVLFFVGCICFVAYILMQKTYSEG